MRPQCHTCFTRHKAEIDKRLRINHLRFWSLSCKYLVCGGDHGKHSGLRSNGGVHISSGVLGSARLPARRRTRHHRGRAPRCVMIAAVKRWHAVFCALLFFIPPGAHAAEDLSGAARDLARQTAVFAGSGEAVSVEYRNASSLGPAELGQARGAFEAALKEAGLRIGDVAPVAEIRLTL